MTDTLTLKPHDGEDSFRPLEWPEGARHRRVYWRYVMGVVFYHFVALMAFLPGIFTWSGLFIAVLGIYVFGGLGINIGYHRLLTHRSFKCPKWLEHGFAVLGVLCLQDSPVRWVAIHRRHHHHSDERPDPHTPLVNFFWAHMGWLMVENDDLDRMVAYQRYAKDILRDPFYKFLERYFVTIVVASWVAFAGGGFLTGLAVDQSVSAGLQWAALMILWGVFVRTVLVWHITWSVNSLSHYSGYRNFETGDDSRNNALVAFLTTGEGWHNNHHADPHAANCSHRWWEFDGIYWAIRGLAVLGLASDIVEREPTQARTDTPKASCELRDAEMPLG